MGRYGADVVIKGQSGREYVFELWELDSYWAEVPAVYFFTRKFYNEVGMGTYPIIHIGETPDLRDCFSNNQAIESFQDEGARLICVLREVNPVVREQIAEDIYPLNRWPGSNHK